MKRAALILGTFISDPPSLLRTSLPASYTPPLQNQSAQVAGFSRTRHGFRACKLLISRDPVEGMIMTMWARICLGCAACFPIATAALGSGAPQDSRFVTLVPGMSAAESQFLEIVKTQAAQRREAWIASGQLPPIIQPQITSGKILTPTLNVEKAPAAPELSVTFTTGSAGVGGIDAVFVSASTSQILYSNYNPTSWPTQGTVAFLTPTGSYLGLYSGGALGLYAAPGTWSLLELSISDRAGNYIVYTQSQLAAIFPSLTITVTNPLKPDTTAPVVSAGKILTPVVHLSSANKDFAVNLTVSDDLSGVFQKCVYVTSPSNAGPFCDKSFTASPVVNGSVNAYFDLAGMAKGTWTISGYFVCDVAGNCKQDLNATDVKNLFGTTTFTVTN
jgi:hypothetical protein